MKFMKIMILLVFWKRNLVKFGYNLSQKKKIYEYKQNINLFRKREQSFLNINLWPFGLVVAMYKSFAQGNWIPIKLIPK